MSDACKFARYVHSYRGGRKKSEVVREIDACLDDSPVEFEGEDGVIVMLICREE